PREHDGGTGACERQGRGFADPASRAGDPGDLAAQARHVSLPHRMVEIGSGRSPNKVMIFRPLRTAPSSLSQIWTTPKLNRGRARTSYTDSSRLIHRPGA